MTKKAWFFPLVFAFLAFLIWFLYWKLLLPPYLTFSDAAKFADSARNLVRGEGLQGSFSFFSSKIVFGEEIFSPRVPSPLFPVSVALSFLILGISDAAVIITSGFFFIASAILIYLLANKLYENLVAILSSLAFIFTVPMIDYAAIGASESLFIFLVLLIFYILILRKKWSVIVGGLLTGLLFLTRPQAPIYFLGIGVFAWFVSKGRRNVLKWLIGVIIILLPAWIYGQLMNYPLFRIIPSSSIFFEHSPLASENVTLRGGAELFSLGVVFANLKPILVKSLYHLYNFYKSLPTFISPYLMTLFVLGLVRWRKKPEDNALKIMTLIILALSFFAASLTIPFMRYIHPVAPLVIILAMEMLAWFVSKIFKRKSLVWLSALLLILFFVSSPTIGKIFLDSRYLHAYINQGKPPIYVVLSQILKENTDPDDLIVTNLDTWGSWYGERKTIWFPLEPSQLIPEEGKESKIDAIYLTSYKIDDENYFMGEAWRKIFYQPEDLEDLFFAENFELAGKFEIPPDETYERERATAILLKRKK